MSYSDYERYRAWRKANPDKRNKSRAKNYSARRFGNGGHPWGLLEIEDITHSDLSDVELAIKWKRSVQAIQMKRSRINSKRRGEAIT